MKKKIIFGVIATLLIIIQFIRPSLNRSDKPQTGKSLFAIYNPPVDVENIIRQSCMDCHSNNTIYPWYNKIEPAGWVLNHHIMEGKDELNIDQFGDYTPRMQKSKLRSMKDQVHDNVMPLKSYRLLHKEARLTAHQKQVLIGWLQKKIDILPN